METKQISNYLVKLHGFKFGPDRSQSALVIKLVSEIQVPVKHSVEGVGRRQVAKSEANAWSALSNRK